MIYALYHSPTETAGLILDIIKEKKLPIKTVPLYEGEGLPRDVSGLEGLIVMGGPMNVDEVEAHPYLLPEVLLIEKVIRERKPVLGICLGAQLIAKALDARVFPNPTREVGWHSIELTKEGQKDSLFKNFPKSLPVLHWHGDTFDLPEGAVPLARSMRCRNQGFRWGEFTYALQFHLEATPAMVKNWCRSEEDEAYVRGAGESPEQILNESAPAYARLEPIARAFFSNYLSAAYQKLLPVA